MAGIDPLEIQRRGYQDEERLSPEERLVFLLMELETNAAMEGWDHFFTGRRLAQLYLIEEGLAAAGDDRSLEVIQSYKDPLASAGVPLSANAIEDFLLQQPESYFLNSPDWREQFDALVAQRWARIAALLAARGYELQL